VPRYNLPPQCRSFAFLWCGAAHSPTLRQAALERLELTVTVLGSAGARRVFVRPAPAGMLPNTARQGVTQMRTPRASGDAPILYGLWFLLGLFDFYDTILFDKNS
jgi:hypothetical protein